MKPGLHGLGPESRYPRHAGVVLQMFRVWGSRLTFRQRPHQEEKLKKRGYPSASLLNLSPQLIQRPLLPRGGEVIPARLVVNQADDDVPHDRTPLLDQGC